MLKQNFPILIHIVQQQLPVDFLVLLENEVRDVGTVIAVSILDEHLGPDELRHTENIHVHSEESCRSRTVNPKIGDRRDEIRGTEDDIDEIIAALHLREPALVFNMCAVSQRGELVQNSREIS